MARAPKKSAELTPEEELVKRIKERIKSAEAYYSDQWEQSKEDTAFCDPAKQWDEQDKRTRDAEGIPSLVVDRMTPFIDQIANDYRQNRQGCEAHPVDDQGDVQTAEIISGLIRHIEYDSKADYAYQTSFLQMLRGGLGYYRLFLDYETPESFEQSIKIGRIPNWEDVIFDPASIEPDGSDANWAAIFHELTEDEYKEQFPGTDLAEASSNQWKNIQSQGWGNASTKTIRVCEYWEKTREKKTILKLEDGTVVDEKNLPEGAIPVSKRLTFQTVVKHYVVNAVEKLAETTFPGQWIPVFPVYGQELVIDGVRRYSGLVHRIKDVQKMVNYWKSTQTWLIAIAPKSPWVGPRGFTGNMTQQWANANRKAYSTLEYEPVIIQGQVMPPPQRNVQEPAIGAITNALMGTEEDLKAVTGMYDPAMGRGDSNQSGIAIQKLQNQGQQGNFHFLDNANRTRGHLYRVMVDLIPYIYDTARTLRIIGVDSTQKTVQVNQETGKRDPKTGKPLLYDLTTGRYDVVVSVGPSYATKRQENLNIMIELVKHLPPDQAGLISDLIASQMDTPIAKEISDRLKKTLPPQFQEPEEGQEQQQQIPPQVQQQMQALSQQHEQLVQALHQAQDELDQQTMKIHAERDMKQMELDSKEKIALLDNETKLQIAQLQAQHESAQFGLEQELKYIQTRMEALEVREQEEDQEDEQVEPPEPQQPQPDHMATIAGAMATMAQAHQRASGAKRLVLHPDTGQPIGVEPMEGGD